MNSGTSHRHPIRFKKARKATEEVEGLLDKDYLIKAEHIEAMRALATQLAKQHTST